MAALRIVGTLIAAILTYLTVIVTFPVLRVKRQPMPHEEKDEPAPSCRQDVSFTVEGQTLRGWLYLPDAPGLKVPCIVLNTGFCGVKDIVTEQYALRFVHAGIAALSFDYRHFGESDGEPRQLYSARKQLADAHGAVAFVRSRPEIDPDKVVIWGTSAGGNYGIAMAAGDPRIAGVIGQCSALDHEVDGKYVLAQAGIGWMLKLLVHAQRDKGRMRLGLNPHMVPAIGMPGTTAVLNVPGAFEGYSRLVKHSKWFRNEVPARTMFEPNGPNIPEAAKNVTCPMKFYQCAKDEIVSPDSHRRVAEVVGSLGEFEVLPISHFDIYEGEWFEKVVVDQVAYAKRVTE